MFFLGSEFVSSEYYGAEKTISPSMMVMAMVVAGKSSSATVIKSWLVIVRSARLPTLIDPNASF